MGADPPGPEPPNGWSRFERVIVYRLDRIDGDLKSVFVELRLIRDEEIGKIKIDVAMLQVKAGVWGAIAGLVPAALIAIYFLLSQ